MKKIRTIKRKTFNDPICKKCKYPLDHEINIFGDDEDIKRYGLNPECDNAWFSCRKCKTEYIIEDYTHKGPKSKEQKLSVLQKIFGKIKNKIKKIDKKVISKSNQKIEFSSP